jgi:hypothetical protein
MQGMDTSRARCGGGGGGDHGGSELSVLLCDSLVSITLC